MSSLQSIDLRLSEAMLKDFDALVLHILQITQSQFGFVSPMLFMYDHAHEQLVLAHGEAHLKFPLQNANHLLAKSFQDQQFFTTNSYQEIFEEPTDEQESSQSTSLYILLPISVRETSIGVIVFATKDQKTLSYLEQLFLQNFVTQISSHLMITWALKNSLELNTQLLHTNSDYLQLIEVKRSFLDQVQEILLQYIQEKNVKEKKKEEIMSVIAYLQSVVLLSDTTIEKNKQNTIYEKTANKAIGNL